MSHLVFFFLRDRVIENKLPESLALTALVFANSKAVTQRCLSTSVPALRWNVLVPAFEMTKLQVSSV